MTFDARETSLDQGEPITWFVFMRGSVSWRYCSADRDMVIGGNTYTAAPISRSAITTGSERRKLNITITLPKDLPVAANWRPYASCETIALTVGSIHYGDTVGVVEWVGRVTAPQFNGGTLTLTAEPTRSAALRPGLKRAWQRGCPLALYSQGRGQCNVNKAARALPATLTVVTGLTLTATAFGTLPSGRLAGGFIEWNRASDGLLEVRSISSHSGSSIDIDFGAADLAAALAVTAYPGCNQTWADCTYYSNTDNYGGDLFLPEQNPYAGNLTG
jgi:hypothetical protein